jgi:hypothetical protein
MDAIERRALLKGAGLGALAFTVGGAQVLLTPAEALAQGVPLRTFKPDEAATIAAMGETLVPGAREAGIVNFIDQQITGSAGDALLEARILNVKPPYANFYRAAIGAINGASTAKHGKAFAELDAAAQHDFVDQMRQNKIDGWKGPPGGFVYFLLRSDAVDVVYGTMAGYKSLDIPYMAHIEPKRSW